MTTLAEKFNYKLITSDSPAETRARLTRNRESKFIDEFTRTDSLVSNTCDLIMELYLLGREDETKLEISNFPALVENKFLGEWQKTCLYRGSPAPQKWHSIISWHKDIRNLCMWCSAVSDWKGIIKCLCFFDDDVEEGKASEAGRAFYIALRYHFEKDFNKRDSYLENVLSGRNKKYREIAETFKSIVDGNVTATHKSWETVFKSWKQKEADKDFQLAPEATFLFYFAEKNGASLSLKDNQKDHIIFFK